MNTDRHNLTILADSNGGESVIRKNDKLIKLEPDIDKTGFTKKLSSLVSTTHKSTAVHQQIKVEPTELSPTQITTSTINTTNDDVQQANSKGQDSSSSFDDKFSR